MTSHGSQEAGATCLGVVKHPAIGIRIPELFLPGILSAYRARKTAGGLMLSYGRETAPEAVIHAAPGTHEITLGHTGTSIRHYQTAGAQAAKEAGVTVEIEADHLIIIGSATAAVQRIAGYHAESHISEEELQKSLEYNKQAIDEAADAGVVGCFTTDTSDLFWLKADELTADETRELFEEQFDSAEGAEILSRYAEPATFEAPGGETATVTIDEIHAMQLALKFKKSLEINAMIYEYCKSKLGDRPFSFEISLDETADMTDPAETLFYITEWKTMGLPCHYFAPNIGFGKRADFTGDMAALEARVSEHHAIASGVSDALLSIHSGSGTTPYSGKGEGTYEALLAGTDGDLKYKISGVYFELLMEMLAALPESSEGRSLYERIFDEVLDLLRENVDEGGVLAQPLLIAQLEGYDRDVEADASKQRDPRADFFRFNSYLTLNIRDDDGRRYFREALVELVEGDDDFRNSFDLEVEALTLRLIDGLHLENNLG